MKSTICPKYEAAFSLLGKRWVGMIIRVLFDGSCRFKDMNERIPNISQKVLADRLKELEGCGLVQRKYLEDKPVKIMYSLTEKGRDLQPVLESVHTWAGKWMKSSGKQ
ncbi:helix-turn-helix domain-containing protein [Bacillus sp. Marseille-Q1617]|uniref:winged helix-turn-helix transcriptional regulator n=1 Tax=Bacillus sp. Marseille-Q1617 TaxID=2736887 RepID=UPI001588C879|nr:helix-turn-helix domain-containing protein [Bacillus sp. Marseille-Q1617]